ncbi:hypothetical protein F5Y08DRAFT_342451 [Xylaria arbuscula]|nr:hypothetical protein F5Y08DRAFT_342451 [Xylaria arbuscula]
MRFQASKLFLSASILAPSLLASPVVESNSTIASLSEFKTLAVDVKEQYCHLNYHYCGWNLINTFAEDYRTRISSKLCTLIGDCNYSSGNIWNSLWNCGADLEFLGLCGGDYSCQDGGATQNDYCQY